MATVIIMAIYACVIVTFDVVDRHSLVGQIDARLDQRLGQIALHPAAATPIADFDNAHDADDGPVFAWTERAPGSPRAITPGAPTLPVALVVPAERSIVASLGAQDFALKSRRVDGRWLVVGQSMAEAQHVLSDLITSEAIAGPILVLIVFLATLLIGVKAAGPIELSRRRQLEFTADASHELRTPLSVIEAEVSLALSSERSLEDYRDTLGRVNRETLRLRHIVDDLLWLSRFDAEPTPPGDEPVDVSVIAAACADRFDGVAQRREITISVHTRGEGRPWINAPPEWIDRLTAVLVDNACRYAGRGGIVQLLVRAQGNRVSLTVEDNGPGIPPEARPGLFDRFRRATDEGNGAGLGLAIADAVARATGGEWHVGVASLGGARIEIRWHRSPGGHAVTEGTGPAPSHTARGVRDEGSPVLR